MTNISDFHVFLLIKDKIENTTTEFEFNKNIRI